jgi:hypothetical protein
MSIKHASSDLNKGEIIRSFQTNVNFKFLSLVAYLTLIFALHRALSFSSLLPWSVDGSSIGWFDKFKIFFVGFLSDFWVALLLALLSVILVSFVSMLQLFRNDRVGLWIHSGTLLSVGFLTSIHQAYVEFFRFQLVPFHLSYLLDTSFIAANSQSLMGIRSSALLGLTILFTFCFNRIPSNQSWLSIIGVLMFGAIAHNRNIYWRVQWFIPDPLQVHYLERLYLNISQNNTPRALNEGEWSSLIKSMNYLGQFNAANPLDILSVLAPPNPTNLDPVVRIFRSEFRQKIQAGKKPVIMVVLLESLRPSETGLYSSSPQSLTPNLDQIASKGFTFLKAYSTGSVTRGGQEAVLCGLQSHRNHSLMRGGILFQYPSCLFNEFTGKGDTFWYHGGDARFDNQLQFWQSQKVKDTLVSDDFPASAARTSWGVGDLTFLSETSKHIAKKRLLTPYNYLFGSVLTISNHIPWDIPADLPQTKLSEPPFTLGKHPSHQSTAYLDYAIGKFVDNLKELSIWENSIVIFLSDHGTSLPPFNNIYEDHQNKELMLYSHIVYIISGGLTEQIISREENIETKINTVTSQSSVAPFIADLIEHSSSIENTSSFSKLLMLAEHPFSKRRERPIISTLEETLFSPENNRSWKIAEINAGKENNDLEVLYYRAIIQMYNTPEIK